MREIRFEEPSLDTGALRLSVKQENNIELLCQVAKQNGTYLSLKEVLELTSLNCTEEELALAWSLSKRLSSKYRIESGFILEAVSSSPNKMMLAQRRIRANRNLRVAEVFAGLFEEEKNLLLFSASGSTSYRSVSEDDDLDFFCITKDNSLWIFLTKALLLARMFQFSHKNVPRFCFSYIMDESCASRLFNAHKDGLFARDAIMAVVIKGQDYYAKLLRENSWIHSFYPKMYELRLSELTESKPPPPEVARPRAASLYRGIANRFLCVLVGNYILLKSRLDNRRHGRLRHLTRMFRPKVDNEKCIFESNDYLELRRKYARLKV